MTTKPTAAHPELKAAYFNIGWEDAGKFRQPEPSIANALPELREAYMQGWRARKARSAG